MTDPTDDVDVLIDDIPLWLGITTDTPYERATAQYQREQVDQQPEAGEQSLAGWWTRSQMSFHFGAGLEYLDTTARVAAEDRLRFDESHNVDPWTPGVIRPGRVLLSPNVTQYPTSGTYKLVPYQATSVAVARLAGSCSLTLLNDANTVTTLTYAGRGTPVLYDAVYADGYFYTATDDGLWKVPVGGGAPTEVYTGAMNGKLAYVKQRLMLSLGGSIYELDKSAAAAALPTPKTTGPSTGWLWLGFAEAPDAILVYGRDSTVSHGAVYRMPITDVSGTPTLGAPVELLTLPIGELVFAALVYLDSMLVLATGRGVRVCPFDQFGGATLGPLTPDFAAIYAPLSDKNRTAVSLAAYGNFIYVGTNWGTVLQLDLGAPIEGGFYAWAPAIDAGATGISVSSVAVTTGFGRPEATVWISGSSLGVQRQQTPAFWGQALSPASDAWLQTSRIRFGTVEEKRFSWLTLRGTISPASPITVSAQTAADPTTWTSVGTLTAPGRIQLSLPVSEWLALRFDLVNGAQLASYQVQALPAGKRQRLISLPVTVGDYQITRSGRQVGYPGWAVERLAALEALEEAGAEVTVSAPALFIGPVRCVIEQLQYTQPTDVGDSQTGTRGSLQVILRTVE